VNFVALDVETANADLSSICQIGIATFLDGRLHSTWKSLINPEDKFDPINVCIHGIHKETVQDAPTWVAVFPTVDSLLHDHVVVSHTAFDHTAVTRACERVHITSCACQWLDSARIVRRAWPIFAHSGYGLSHIADYLGIQFQPHDALEDARCAGEILLRAIADTGLEPEQWLTRVKQPIHLTAYRCDGNPDGPLYGEVLVFTGTLSMPRREATNAASLAGCRVDSRVTRDTTLLVVGDQDVRKLAGYDRSAKHRKATELIKQRQHIRILSEGDFRRIVLSLAEAQSPRS